METTIATQITFAEYMEQALYGPQGYYASGHAKSGKDGDYFTAPDVGPALGRLLGLIFQGWQKKLEISPFCLVEAGAGEGSLAHSILNALSETTHPHPQPPSLRRERVAEGRVRVFPYLAIERSSTRRKILEDQGLNVLTGIEDLAAHPVSGCLFGNELIDAFPVHRVRMAAGKLQEAYVEENQWVWGTPSTPRLQSYLDRIHIELPEDYQTEINLEMSRWFKEAAKGLEKGLILLIDYGRPAYEYYAPERDRGTLRSFRKHRVAEDILSAPGLTDLTADVDFTSAALDARAAGFTPLAFMELGSFLMEGAKALSASAPIPKGLKYLIHPDGMGAAFHVLVLGKNIKSSSIDFPHNRLARLAL